MLRNNQAHIQKGTLALYCCQELSVWYGCRVNVIDRRPAGLRRLSRSQHAGVIGLAQPWLGKDAPSYYRGIPGIKMFYF